MRRWLRQLHRDSSGAISVLVLLTIWCFVALIAMLWNTAEFSMRRQHVQNAADSAAHAAAMWQSRTLNAISGQNMAICRDASCEAIWLAAIKTGGDPNDGRYPNSGSIYAELSKELQDATAGVSNIAALRRRLQQLSRTIEVEYELSHTALVTLAGSVANNVQGTQQQKAFSTKVRQASSALDWVENTYVSGASPTAGRPGPPGPNGEGLYKLVDDWNVDATLDRQILAFIMSEINGPETDFLSAFQSQVYPATSQPVNTVMQAHEEQVFAQEQSERDSVPDAIDQQIHRTPGARSPDAKNVEDFYNATVTLATTKQAESQPTVADDLGMAGSGTVSAPVASASEADGIAGQGYSDSIRNSQRVIPYSNPPVTYQQAAEFARLPLTFDIDPISPHTVAHDGPTGQWLDARIWHPDMPTPIGNALYPVRCNIGGGWGHLWLMPMERYLNERIWHDQANLRPYLVALDTFRYTPTDTGDLAHQIWKMQKLPPNPTIKALPDSIPDDTKNEQGGFDNIPVLPGLQNPPNISGVFNSEIQIYNIHSQRYLGAVRELRADLLRFVSAYEEYYRPFAAQSWDNNVFAAHETVMEEMAHNGTFMILSTYKLRPIPPWAQRAMHDTIQEQVAEQIISQNIGGAIAALGGGNVTGTAVRPFADQAMAALRATAYDAANEIADEWINRPWPYEIEPPHADSDSRPVYVPTGIPKWDREDFFSSLAVAVDQKSPQPLLAIIFGQADPLAAYAQGEAFNWMEFNNNYGGNEQFDNPSYIPYFGFGAIGCPRGWRLSTVGGWNWQPRLSLSDALPRAAQLNPQIQEALQKAGIANTDEATLSPINLH